MHRTHPSAVHGSGSFGHLVVDVTGPEHGPRLVSPVLGLQPTLDSLLAIAKNFGIGSIHSKWPFVVVAFSVERAFHPTMTGISSFLFKSSEDIALDDGLVKSADVVRPDD